MFAPCATGAILDEETIAQLQTAIVCGAANNQLADADRDDQALHDRGILYVPDFLVNRMGIVNCANEQYGYVAQDDSIERHLSRDWEQSVFQMTKKVLKRSKELGETPGISAQKIAEELSLKNHPLWGHRGQKIIDGLVEDNWHQG